MKTKILLYILVLGSIAGCDKDKYTTKPQLKYKDVNTRVLNRNQFLRFNLEVTNAEGDIQDSIFIQKVSPRCAGFTVKYKIPDFTGTKNLKADLEICYGYGNGLGCPIIQPQCFNGRNDTSTFRFWVKDKGNNVSDTVISDAVVITQ